MNRASITEQLSDLDTAILDVLNEQIITDTFFALCYNSIDISHNKYYSYFGFFQVWFRTENR